MPGPGPCRAAWGAEVPAQGRQQRGGFTLIEVLIAAAILGVGLTALLTAASRCLAVMRAAQQYQDAQWALNLGELEHPVLPTQDYKDWEVSAEAYDHGMTYSREVEEPDEERKDGLYLLRSRVTWSSKNRRGYEEVVRYVFVKEKAEL
ncbi:MAG: prepilin-type N-terminal cleavage/methylation domain-containing protein [Lentisphaerae bacterium]|nr:prepilin-type N-terminal cleavage/methylation domain-containing protein [Lentisphaerota bacterium]